MTKAALKPIQHPLSEAPAIVPGVTRTDEGLVVRELIFRDTKTAAVYLSSRFEVDEICYFTIEPTKRKPEGKSYWKVMPRRGAPRLSVRAP